MFKNVIYPIKARIHVAVELRLRTALKLNSKSLESFFEALPNDTQFIQIGANDGDRADPINRFVVE